MAIQAASPSTKASQQVTIIQTENGRAFRLLTVASIPWDSTADKTYVVASTRLDHPNISIQLKDGKLTIRVINRFPHPDSKETHKRILSRDQLDELGDSVSSLHKLNEFQKACLYGESETVKFLMKDSLNLEILLLTRFIKRKGSVRMFYPLHLAVVSGDYKTVEALMDVSDELKKMQLKAVDIDDKTPLDYATSKGRINLYSLLKTPKSSAK